MEPLHLSQPALDVEQVLAAAPTRPHLPTTSKHCVRLDITRASMEELQAELCRVDALLSQTRLTKNRAVAVYKRKRRATDPEFHEKDKEMKRRSDHKRREARRQAAQDI